MKGFTVIEILVALVVASILALIGDAYLIGEIDCKKQRITGAYTKAKVTGAIGDVGIAYLTLKKRTEFIQGPVNLGELNLGTDSWGNEYQFLDHSTVEGHGKKRKAWSQVPVNSQYDFYSMGPDGETSTPMTSEPGGDDIVVANDGQYIGVACLYEAKPGRK